ncbi:GAP family protein [Oerskovia turbata]|uniref:GAP family protein n=2 Tax=Oerskovia turbata TaxID=1713 RepID=A0A4Q1KRV3_9CELL|nr:GAP family protein [Oerskovia turbata]RXR32079.1 GAP family protein [Oerskovia turbata]
MNSMAEVVGAALPLAVAVALSPLPIIALALLLTSDRGRASGVTFVVGRLLALAALLGVVVAASDVVEHLLGSSELPVWVRIVLGAALMLLGLTQWRPKPEDESASLPGWLASIADASPARGLVLGALITVANPKELAFVVAAGVSVGGAALGFVQEVVVVLAFVLVGGLSVLVPLVATLVAPARVAPWLDRLREWLTANTSLVMGVLLLVIGATVLGNAIGEL